MYFCPPPPRRNTASGDAEKIDKVRSALGMHYQLDLHFAVGHMRRWDGAYPPLTNGTKAVSLMTALDVKGPRCVCARVNAACSKPYNHFVSGTRCARGTQSTGTGSTGFTSQLLQSISQRSARNLCRRRKRPSTNYFPIKWKCKSSKL